jgi:hypothetical protein
MTGKRREKYCTYCLLSPASCLLPPYSLLHHMNVFHYENNPRDPIEDIVAKINFSGFGYDDFPKPEAKIREICYLSQ